MQDLKDTNVTLRTNVAVVVLILPVHDYPMWNVNTLYVFMVVFRVSEQVQAISWPVIFYLGQTGSTALLGVQATNVSTAM